MKRFGIALILAIVGSSFVASVTLAGGGTTDYPWHQHSSYQGRLDSIVDDSCTGELVQITGIYQSRWVAGQDGQGSYHYQEILRSVEATARGLTSGMSYTYRSYFHVGERLTFSTDLDKAQYLFGGKVTLTSALGIRLAFRETVVERDLFPRDGGDPVFDTVVDRTSFVCH